MFFFSLPRWSVCVLDIFILILVRVRTKRYLKLSTLSLLLPRTFSLSLSLSHCHSLVSCCKLVCWVRIQTLAKKKDNKRFGEKTTKWKSEVHEIGRQRKLNSTQYSFHNGKKKHQQQKTTTNGNYSCWNKIAFPWNVNSFPFFCMYVAFPFSFLFPFSLFAFLFSNNFVVFSIECQTRMRNNLMHVSHFFDIQRNNLLQGVPIFTRQKKINIEAESKDNNNGTYQPLQYNSTWNCCCFMVY